MKPAPFRYERACDVDEAVALLAEHGDEAKILAGGQSLIPLVNMRLVRPSVLVDINRLVEIDGIRLADGHLIIGAVARDRDVELSAEARRRCPVLVEALHHVGHVEIRNRGTVCGSLAHADPAAELPVVAVAVEAQLVARSLRGTRTIAAGDFFRSFLTMDLAADELLTEVRFPALPPGAGWGFVEFARRHGDFALTVAAVVLEQGPGGVCRAARIAVGGVGPTPLRARPVETSLVGAPLSRDRFAAAGLEVAAMVSPPSDIHASGDYRRKVTAVAVERALVMAAQRAST
ncbi:MAG: FAD binding domain-containing protein [Candidatus Rokuibacteriota bacterium]